MYRNLPRIVWQMKRDEDSNTVGLIPNKINTLGDRPKPFALNLETDGDAIRYVSADMASVPTLSKKLSLPDRITALLRDGALSVQGITEELDEKEPNVRTTLNRGKNKRYVQNVATGTWGNMAHNTQEETPSKSGGEGITQSPPPVRGADVIPPAHNNVTTGHNTDKDVMPSDEPTPRLPGDFWDDE
jgi:hypothetical protein